MPTFKDLKKWCTGVLDPKTPKDPMAPPGTEKFCAYLLDLMELGKKHGLTQREVIVMAQTMQDYTPDE